MTGITRAQFMPAQFKRAQFKWAQFKWALAAPVPDIAGIGGCDWLECCD